MDIVRRTAVGEHHRALRSPLHDELSEACSGGITAFISDEMETTSQPPVGRVPGFHFESIQNDELSLSCWVSSDGRSKNRSSSWSTTLARIYPPARVGDILPILVLSFALANHTRAGHSRSSSRRNRQTHQWRSGEQCGPHVYRNIASG